MKVDTLAYDMGVFALGAVGLGVMVAFNLVVGGILTLGAPVLAMFFKDRIDAEIKRKAEDSAPAAVRAVSAKIGPELLATIDRFGATAPTDFVVQANDELRRSMIEVLVTTRRTLSEAKEGEAPSVRGGRRAREGAAAAPRADRAAAGPGVGAAPGKGSPGSRCPSAARSGSA